MSLTTEQLAALARIAEHCQQRDGELFEARVLPQLDALDEGELWALAGMLLALGLSRPEIAEFVADYANGLREARWGNFAPARDAADLWRIWLAIDAEAGAEIEDDGIPGPVPV